MVRTSLLTDAVEALPDDPSRCPWCGAVFASSRRHDGWARCDACLVGVTAPWPTPHDLDEAYGPRYRPPMGRFVAGGDRVLRWTRGRPARRIAASAPGGPILDIGSGAGVLLDAFADLGRSAVGVERPTGDSLRDWPQGPWAAIVFWHSLEHLQCPGGAIRWAADHLMPDGVVAIAVPNIASFQSRTFGRRWLALDLPRHLVHLTPADVSAALRAAGFRIVKISHWRAGQVVFGWLHGLVGSCTGVDLYDVIRRPEARFRPLTRRARVASLAAALLLLPIAAIAAVIEMTARHGGSIYIEARRPRD